MRVVHFAIAAIFGLASTLSVILLGDESGYELGDVQKTKLAAIEAEWDTHPAPAPFTLFGIPNKETMTTDYASENSICDGSYCNTFFRQRSDRH